MRSGHVQGWASLPDSTPPEYHLPLQGLLKVAQTLQGYFLLTAFWSSVCHYLKIFLVKATEMPDVIFFFQVCRHLFRETPQNCSFLSESKGSDIKNSGQSIWQTAAVPDNMKYSLVYLVANNLLSSSFTGTNIQCLSKLPLHQTSKWGGWQ